VPWGLALLGKLSIQNCTETLSSNFTFPNLNNIKVKPNYLNFVQKNTKHYKFQAIIFEEEKPRGKVRLKALGGK
jgi:AMMECR1 domain-containing protein